MFFHNTVSAVCFEIHLRRECWCGRFIRKSWCGGLSNPFQSLGSAVQARGVAVRPLTTRVNEKKQMRPKGDKETGGMREIHLSHSHLGVLCI